MLGDAFMIAPLSAKYAHAYPASRIVLHGLERPPNALFRGVCPGAIEASRFDYR